MSRQEGFPSQIVRLKRPKKKKRAKSKLQIERERKLANRLREETRRYAMEHGIEI